MLWQDARDFGKDGYTLRVNQHNQRIKLLICVTLVRIALRPCSWILV